MQRKEEAMLAVTTVLLALRFGLGSNGGPCVIGTAQLTYALIPIKSRFV